MRNWLDLQIDAPEVIATLAEIGYPVGIADKRVCHFSCDMRAGLFDLYRTVLRTPDRLPLPYLAQALPEAQAPRRSRLFARPRTARRANIHNHVSDGGAPVCAPAHSPTALAFPAP